MTSLSATGPRVLVVGATGFVGCRVIERLMLDKGTRVRALIRDFGHAARIGRFPVEMVRGDVLDRQSLKHATSGCDIVIHCAYGNSGSADVQRRVTVDGTKNVFEAACSANVKRIVYLSSLSVYGIPADGDLTESSPRRVTGTVYADSKLQAERVAASFIRDHGAPISILQPTIIYGPYGPLWTVGVIKALQSAGLLLVDGGQGICNAVYVDDVVSAIALAMVEPNALGETFLISAAEPVTWKNYYAGYEAMLGLRGRLVSVSANDALRMHRQDLMSRRLVPVTGRMLGDNPSIRETITATPEMAAVLRAARRAIPARTWTRLKERALGKAEPAALRPHWAPAATVRPIAPHPIDVRLQSSKAKVRINKATRLLGYRPQYDLERGLSAIGEWAKWANLSSDQVSSASGNEVRG